MDTEYNIYCDESNHLENDNSKIMTIGAVYLNKNKVTESNERIRSIKKRNNIDVKEELKWTRITKGRLEVYKDLVNYFFDTDFLLSRTIVVTDKSGLKHEIYSQTHDTWYYKMHYRLIENIIEPNCSYNIYLDYKDTNMHYRGEELKQFLQNRFSNFSNVKINKVQPIRSHEVEIMQIVDIIIGAIAYKNKKINTSSSKLEIIELIEKRSNANLLYSSVLREKKLNVFMWNMAGDSREL